MSNVKIEMKIGRYIKKIGKDDLILDNNSCIQVTTQTGAFSQYGYSCLSMSKTLFNALKRFEFIFVDEEATKKANENYKKAFLTYYRFDIDKMIEHGYKVVQD